MDLTDLAPDVLDFTGPQIGQFCDLLEQQAPVPLRSGQISRLRHAVRIQGVRTEAGRVWTVTLNQQRGQIVLPIAGLP